MYTVRFQVRPHLAAYMYARYSKSITMGVIHLPANGILFHLLHHLAAPQPPSGWRAEKGNLALQLPSPNDGKSPRIYNYLSDRSIEKLEAAIDLQMHMELYEFIRNNKFRKGIMYMTSARLFREQHNMWDITEEALIKSYQRWRVKEQRGRKEE